MKIIFLGTAGYHPSETRQTTSVFLPEIGFLLDAGTGSFRIRDLIETPHLDIFLSHAHLDHLIGVTYLLDMLWGKGISPENVTVHGKKSHLNYLMRHIYGSLGFPVRWEETGYQVRPVSKEFSVRGVTVRTKILPHPGLSVGYRFTFSDGKVLTYIMDTTTSGKQLPLMKNADLIIHECNFPGNLEGLPMPSEQWAEKTGHSTAPRVNELALKARVKRLALVHFNPLDTREDPTDQINASVKFPNVIVARDLMEIEL